MERRQREQHTDMLRHAAVRRRLTPFPERQHPIPCTPSALGEVGAQLKLERRHVHGERRDGSELALARTFPV